MSRGVPSALVDWGNFVVSGWAFSIPSYCLAAKANSPFTSMGVCAGASRVSSNRVIIRMNRMINEGLK